MESERRKVYVEVNVTHRPDGTARPNVSSSLKMVKNMK
mgnify:CR=1 FL=1